MKEDDSIKLTLTRDKQNMTLEYKLTKIEKPKKHFMQQPKKDEKKPELKKSRQQQREQKEREFKKFHAIPPERKEMIEKIRERLLKNMKSRARNRRVR